MEENAIYDSYEGFARLMNEAYQKYYVEQHDPEVAHVMMDKIMYDTLSKLGYWEGCEIFRKLDKRWN